MKPATWILSGIGATALLVSSTAAVLATHAANQIDVCCAWNGALNDSNANNVADLTYSISGGSALDQGTVRAAVADWQAALTGTLELNEVPPTDKAANIKIKLVGGGGRVAGSALRRFSGSFINSVSLKITLKSFGIASDQPVIAEITRHEMGHALGTGHANFNDLMDPTVGGANTISACDVDGVKAAQHWKLVDPASAPHAPHVNHVGC
jgi:hypothetical protein